MTLRKIVTYEDTGVEQVFYLNNGWLEEALAEKEERLGVSTGQMAVTATSSGLPPIKLGGRELTCVLLTIKVGCVTALLWLCRKGSCSATR